MPADGLGRSPSRKTFPLPHHEKNGNAFSIGLGNNSGIRWGDPQMRNFLAFWLVCGQRFRLPPTYFWFHVLLFSMGAMMVAPAESYYAIFATARLGESTRDALVGDFELSLIEDAILTGFGVLLFSGAVVFFARKGFGPTRLGFWLSIH